ncbi:lipopolysaccharide biosynthesis protein [Oleiagrimonas sp. C23AA]|uniref:lipopolysaccharide biosynthesis protein n=1 Tax=Oleiagrimonas sp. C23AA TaxID=2719047 RepID=UPI001422944E|nr:lipopolysaccharide biosynthesis protein [Oleiagrimonas sp. C23AA]NII11442.1 lipopolysaccharide biosynthesis protein [Oleiagrimonas sp. C23AA]
MKGPIAHATIRTSFVLGGRLVVQAGTLLLVARMLGPQLFGAFAGITSLAVILGTLSTFGTHLVLLGEVSREPSRRQAVLSYSIPTTLLAGGFLLVIYLLICTQVLRESGAVLQVLLAIGITELWLQPLFNLMAIEHLALGRTARSQLLTILPLALRLLAATTVFLMQPSAPLEGYAYGYLAASLIALFFGATTIPAPWPELRLWHLPITRQVRESAGYAAINISKAGPSELDKTLAAKLLPLGAAGMYAVGTRVIGAITLPVIAMILAALPRMFRENRVEQRRNAHLLRWMFSVAMIYGFFLSMALWFAAPLLDGFFGPKYHGLGQTLRWLCLAVPGMTLRLVEGNVLMASGKVWMRVGFEASGVGVLTLAAFLLTPRLGTAGMLTSLACAEWSMALAGAILIVASRREQQLKGFKT